MVVKLRDVSVLDTYELDCLRVRLEDQYEAHTARLAAQVNPARQARERAGWPRAAGDDVPLEGSRRALADIAQALRRMAEGSYGRCLLCEDLIATSRLRQDPATHCCSACLPDDQSDAEERGEAAG